MSVGSTGGDANELKGLPCLLGRHRDTKITMAKAKPLKVDDETRFLVLARGQYKCERCRRDFMRMGVSIHHRRPRMMGGSKNPDLHKASNLIALCGSGTSGCHGWVENNRASARAFGYLLENVESAEQAPFKDMNGTWWLIDNDGSKKELDLNGRVPHD